MFVVAQEVETLGNLNLNKIIIMCIIVNGEYSHKIGI